MREDLVGGAECAQDIRRRKPEAHGEEDSESQREPHAVDAGAQRLCAAPCAEQPAYRRCSCVCEKDAQSHDGHEKCRGHREPGQFGSAESADDRGVDEDEQRFGDECAEGGDGEREDLAVVSTSCLVAVHLLVFLWVKLGVPRLTYLSTEILAKYGGWWTGVAELTTGIHSYPHSCPQLWMACLCGRAQISPGVCKNLWMRIHGM